MASKISIKVPENLLGIDEETKKVCVIILSYRELCGTYTFINIETEVSG